jgi:site-specific recombinase XerD
MTDSAVIPSASRDGHSRQAWRETHCGFGKMAEKTLAWNSERRYKGACLHLVKWCPERYHIHQVCDITPLMVRPYIDSRRATGQSLRTLSTDITSIRRLGMYTEIVNCVAHNFVPADLSVPHGSNPRYSYAPEHEQAIIDYVVAERNVPAAEVLRMQRAADLRIDEAIHARIDKIDFERGTIEVKGKGGKIRMVTVTVRPARLDAALSAIDRSCPKLDTQNRAAGPRGLRGIAHQAVGHPRVSGRGSAARLQSITRAWLQ